MLLRRYQKYVHFSPTRYNYHCHRLYSRPVSTNKNGKTMQIRNLNRKASSRFDPTRIHTKWLLCHTFHPRYTTNLCFWQAKRIFFPVSNTCLNKLSVFPSMGSPGSPAYAICICMYYEHIFNNKLLHLQKQLTDIIQPQGPLCKGLRYVDDLIAFFPYNKNNKISYAIALFIKDYLSKYTYHPDMLLKDEPIQDNSFDFLETTITYKGHTDFDIKHKR